MNRLLRHAAATLAAALTLGLALSACSGLPTSGPVNPGLSVDEEVDPPDFSFVADPPRPGATPQEIVDGFIAAGSGARNDWATAQEYLTESFRGEWTPTAGVTVEVPGDREYTETAPDAISVTLTAEAVVDSAGAYDAAGAGTLTLPFELAQEGGEWRISQAPPGVVLDHDRFEVVFRSYSVMYFDPTWTFLVPDVRWFPTTNPATRIASALIDGVPSPWLEGAVASAVTENASLAARSVPVQQGTAQVELASTALNIDSDTLDRMQTQLEASMLSAGIGSVQMTVDGQPLSATPVAVRSTLVPARALVLTEDGFGFLSGTTIESLPTLSERIVAAEPTAIQLAPDQDAAALQLGDGTVAHVSVEEPVAVIDERAGLIEPTIDPFGWVWSVPRGDPSAVHARGTDGTVIDVEGAWTDATEISAMQISRDGTRMAALVTDGSRPGVWVAGVVRDEDGVPRRLGVPQLLSTLSAPGIDLGWLDATSLGVVAAAGSATAVVEQPLGGAGTVVTAPSGITTIAGTNQTTAVRLRNAEGVLFVRRGTNWGSAAEGVLVLATQQGSPR